MAPDRSIELQRWSRRLLAAAAVLLVFTGFSFFLLPDYATENFPWSVSPFIAMTVGAWALGMGLTALETVREWFLRRVQAALVALWSFSILQLIVVMLHAAALRTDHWMTWPYLAALAFGSASAALGLPALWLERSSVADGEGVPAWIRNSFIIFVAVLGVLGLATLLVTPTGGAVFPEPLTPFTARAFSAFFFALGLGAVPLLLTRASEPFAWYARNGLYMIVLIVVAAFSYLHLFDVAARPGQLIYFGAYVITAIVAGAIMAWDRRSFGTTWRP